MARVNRRLMALIAALALAALAAFSLLSYVRGVEERAAAEDENVLVLYAEELIPAGTSAADAAEQGWLDTRPVPRRVVAVGALGGIEPLAGLVATTDIFPGEQVLTNRFASPDEARGFLPIPEGHQAMTVEVGVPPGVAGFIRAGDRISLLATIEIPDPLLVVAEEALDATPDDPFDDEEIETISMTKFLLQDIAVLSVGRRVIIQGEEEVQRPEDRVLLTLAVDGQAAEKLAYAISHGTLYGTLLPEDAEPEDATVDTEGRTLRNAFEEALQ